MKKSMLLVAAISLFVSLVAQARSVPPRPVIPRQPNADTCPNGQPRDADGRCAQPAFPYQPR